MRSCSHIRCSYGSSVMMIFRPLTICRFRALIFALDWVAIIHIYGDIVSNSGVSGSRSSSEVTPRPSSQSSRGQPGTVLTLGELTWLLDAWLAGSRTRALSQLKGQALNTTDDMIPASTPKSFTTLVLLTFATLKYIHCSIIKSVHISIALLCLSLGAVKLLVQLYAAAGWPSTPFTRNQALDCACCQAAKDDWSSPRSLRRAVPRNVTSLEG